MCFEKVTGLQLHVNHKCKNVQVKVKNVKNVKNVTKIKKTSVNVIKKLPLLSVVQFHA